MVSPTEFRTVPSDEVATISQFSFFEAPCSIAETTSSRTSPDSHSSMVATVGRRPWSLSMDIGRTSSRLPLVAFSMPFLVATSLACASTLPPDAPGALPNVRNEKTGPRWRWIAVRYGPMISSACFIVGATVMRWTASAVVTCSYAWMVVSYKDLALPRDTTKYCLLINRFLMRLLT